MIVNKTIDKIVTRYCRAINPWEQLSPDLFEDALEGNNSTHLRPGLSPPPVTSEHKNPVNRHPPPCQRSTAEVTELKRQTSTEFTVSHSHPWLAIGKKPSRSKKSATKTFSSKPTSPVAGDGAIRALWRTQHTNTRHRRKGGRGGGFTSATKTHERE